MDIFAFLNELGLFAAKAFVLVFFFAVALIIIALFAARNQGKSKLKIENLKDKFDHYKEMLDFFTYDKADLKKLKKKKKEEKKKDSPSPQPIAYVLDFDGDVKAQEVDSLREEVTAILLRATALDEVVIKVESPGGVVHGYGLAAAQIMRLHEKNIPVTVCVDKVAASGGYLMSVPAKKILAAPFAIIGSIGVVAQVPNLHRLLKKHDVDYKEYTAGEFKRTVSFFGELTMKGEQKFVQQLEETHTLFKSFVHRYRPHLDLSKVATGEYWFGEQALQLGLIDGIKTSDEYLMELAQTHKTVQITYEEKQKWSEKISNTLGSALSRGALRILQELESRKFF